MGSRGVRCPEAHRLTMFGSTPSLSASFVMSPCSETFFASASEPTVFMLPKSSIPERHLCQEGIEEIFRFVPDRAKSLGVEPKRRAKKLPPALRSIGTRAEEARSRTGLTQTALAQRLGVKPNQISRLESGQRLLRTETMLALCRELGAPVGYVLGGEGELPVADFIETDRRRRHEPQGD